MANYSILKNAIAEVIKYNGNNEISGNTLQQTLIAIVNSLGSDYLFAGIATPTTEPGTPDQNVFYIAPPGIYTNFGNKIVPNGYLGILTYNGSWNVLVCDINSSELIMFPPIIQKITRETCINIDSYIDEHGNITAQPSYGYSEIIPIQKGNKLSMYGVGNGIPFFIYCTETGQFISSSRISQGLNDVYNIVFTQDGYIRINGRIALDGNGIVNGLIYDGDNIPSLSQKVLQLNGALYKYIAARNPQFNIIYASGVKYVKITLNTLMIYDVLESSAKIINNSNEYTLGGDNRFLVLTSDDNIAIRSLSSQILTGDKVLLYYDDNSYNGDIVGGALFPFFLSSQVGWIATEPKLIYSVDATYRETANSLTVILDSVIYYDGKRKQFVTVYADGDSTEHHPKEFTFSGILRYVVIASNGQITTRQTNSQLLYGDTILYLYNTTINKLIGGHLFCDYLNKKVNTTIKDIPQNLGQINCVRKAYQMANIQWTPKSNAIPNNIGSFPASEQRGMIYSSVKEFNQFIFEDVSLETFMTAVNNPRSVLYTENVSAQNSQSVLGRTYHGVNCAAYYGSVCSGLLTFAYGLPVNVTTYEFRNWDKMEEILDQTPYGLQIGDAIWQTGHIQLVTGITRDNYGVITDIEIVENGDTTAKIRHYTVSSLQNYITANNCVLLRYKELYKNRDYTPLLQFVAVENEILGQYDYNNDICPNYGNKSCYNEGDNIVLNLRTDYANAGFTTLEVYKDDTVTPIVSRAISGIDETLTGLEYGNYKARIIGSEIQSDYVQFKVVNATVIKNGNLFTFGSENATPLYYEFCDLQGRRSYDIVGLSTHQFTDAEISSGEATPVSPIISTGDYHYLKVHFQTEFGRVIKVIDWEA